MQRNSFIFLSIFFLFSILADKQQVLVRQHFERRWVSPTVFRYRNLIF